MTVPASSERQPERDLVQLPLAVAGDAGHADELAGAHLEGDRRNAVVPSSPSATTSWMSSTRTAWSGDGDPLDRQGWHGHARPWAR